MHSESLGFNFSTKIICGLFLSLSLMHPAQAAIDEIYRLSIGANLASYNTDLSINSRDFNIDSIIDFEDDLGYDKDVSGGWISGWYRVGDLHRIKLTYTPLNRSSRITNTRDIVINNTTIKAGASVLADTSSDIFDFSYIYSFHKTEQLELGFSAGIYWLSNQTKFLAAGQVQGAGEDQPSFKADYFSEQKLQAPMPLIGFSADYEIIPSWRVHGSVRYLSVQLSDIDGRIFSAEVGTEYYFNNNWGVGASLAAFDLDVEVKRLYSSTALGWSHNGAQVYMIFKY